MIKLFIILFILSLLGGCATITAGADKYEKFCETHPLICGGDRPIIINRPPPLPIVINPQQPPIP